MKFKRIQRNHAPMLYLYASVCLSALGITGCATPTTQIGQFGLAAAAVTQYTADAYELFNETTVERKLYALASESDARVIN